MPQDSPRKIMVIIGKLNKLMVTRQSLQGLHLDAGSDGEIIMSRRFASPQVKVGALAEVFVFVDAEGNLAATSKAPLAQVGDIAWLKVVSVNRIGAFLDWGLPKDLLLPGHEQLHDLRPGDYCMVKIYIDDQQRITATEHLSDFLAETSTEYRTGQKVSVLIGDTTPLGVRVVVDNTVWGLIYSDDIFAPIEQGQRLSGFIRKLREDGKLDVTLNQAGYARVGSIADVILDKLREHKGFMPFTDKSPPDAVYATFGVSKKVFKQAIGTLFKQRRILIEKDGIRLV
jgi:predicted RNA-binding protein (virulence factor B family)